MKKQKNKQNKNITSNAKKKSEKRQHHTQFYYSFLTIILLAIFTIEFLNFCTNALIWVNLDRKERENEKHID